jgi:hypothetical protein
MLSLAMLAAMLLLPLAPVSARAAQVDGIPVDRIGTGTPTASLESGLTAAAPIATDMKRFVGVAAAPLAAAPGGSAFATLYVSAPVVIAGAEADTAHHRQAVDAWRCGRSGAALHRAHGGRGRVARCGALRPCHSRHGQQTLDTRACRQLAGFCRWARPARYVVGPVSRNCHTQPSIVAG